MPLIDDIGMIDSPLERLTLTNCLPTRVLERTPLLFEALLRIVDLSLYESLSSVWWIKSRDFSDPKRMIFTSFRDSFNTGRIKNFVSELVFDKMSDVKSVDF